MPLTYLKTFFGTVTVIEFADLQNTTFVAHIASPVPSR